jgi:uncharacterized protein
MSRKEDVRFLAEGRIELSAWLFMPERRAAPLPAITMAHSYAGTKYHGLEPMAEASFGSKRRTTWPSPLE